MTGIALIPNLIGHFISFLTIVGSIFVPLIAIMLVDYFLIKKQKVVPEEMLAEDSTSKYWFKGGFNWKAIIIWLIGAVMYNMLYYFWPVLGSCIPTFLVIGILYYLVADKK
ncbi:MAG: cytosine permease [Angelakisella sp.]